MGNWPSFSRKAPMASKFSKAKPMGSMRAWQEAQIGFSRCCSMTWRSVPVSVFLLVEVGHVGRRRRRGRAEELLENPLAAFDGRGAGGVGGEREDAGLGEEAAAVGRRADLAEVAAFDAVDAVVLGEAVVDEGEVGVEEVEDAAVLAEDVVEEQLGLFLHRGAEVFVEVGEELGDRA